MKIHNTPTTTHLPVALTCVLDAFRAERGFDADAYSAAKAAAINAYFRRCGLTAAIVGLSGGIDSAVALALLHHAQTEDDSPIARVIPIALPASQTAGATGQDDALRRAAWTADAFGYPLAVVDIRSTIATIKAALDDALGIAGEPWAEGQLVSYARTPCLYYVTSLLTQSGERPVVVGTTNRDEGAYLGYVGKASDGMVDLQVISDLHKSEVRRVAAHLGVPDPVQEAKPTGDMFDGRTDEDVFGAPYDFVELYLQFRCLPHNEQLSLLRGLSRDDQRTFDAMAANLDRLHAHNAHKYNVGSPAVHLDILPTAVPGGWSE